MNLPSITIDGICLGCEDEVKYCICGLDKTQIPNEVKYLTDEILKARSSGIFSYAEKLESIKMRLMNC